MTNVSLFQVIVQFFLLNALLTNFEMFSAFNLFNASSLHLAGPSCTQRIPPALVSFVHKKDIQQTRVECVNKK